MTSLMQKTYNLRKELARQIWNARSGQINIAEALENTRELVSLFPDEIMEIANALQHKIMNQAAKVYGKICLRKKGIDADGVKAPAVKSRFYLGAVMLPENYIG
jgi:hypothetical protein